MTAADAMTPDPPTVTPRTSVAERAVEPALTLPAGIPLAEAARHLLDRAANGALVVDGDRLVGIPNDSDLLRALVPRAPEIVV
ncbi:MAG TPA: CBS domain-containing protein [Methylomirabilota bacterium]|nr:CBS domain-containing protein [Methylomirabilota bacterium]